MCFACEQDQMLGAYREYIAQRKAARAAAIAAGDEKAAAISITPDWAKNTWFAAAVEAEE